MKSAIKLEKAKVVFYLLIAFIFFVTVYNFIDLLIHALNLKNTMYEIIGRSAFASERPKAWEFIRDRAPV